MRNLVYLFIRYGGFITFLLLEAVCFYLIVNNNEEQGKVWLHSSSLLSGNLNDKYDNLTDYISLQEQRDSMAAENARLRKKLGISRFDIALNQDTIVNPQDTQRYVYIPAEVIDNSTTRSDNYLTIARGTDHGIKPRMGVIGSNGIVGHVKQCSRHFSTVISILHSQMKISVRHKPSQFVGTMMWQGINADEMLLKYIPRFVPVAVGDTITTSGYSLHFPSDIAVGTVVSTTQEAGSTTQDIQVKLVNDMRKQHSVYVVKDYFEEELRSLKTRPQ